MLCPNYLIIILQLSLVLSFGSKVNKTKIDFHNTLNNTLNVTNIKQQIKSYEKEYIDIYIKSSKNEELFCDKVDNNIKSLVSIRDKFAKIENDISSGFISDFELREYIDIKADASFSMRNIDNIVKKLKKKKKICVNNNKDFEKIREKIKSKTKVKKENIIKQILQFENNL